MRYTEENEVEFGPDSVNPALPQERNIDWVLRQMAYAEHEIVDLVGAMTRFRQVLESIEIASDS